MPSKKWAVIFDKCDPNKQKYRQKLIPDAKCQQCRVFVRNDLVEKMIKSCRLGSKKKKSRIQKKARTRPWQSCLWWTRSHRHIEKCIWRRNHT